MSSLNAARADTFYYPPEWEPKHGGISKFQGSKGKNQYEQYGIIRFELPYNSWCLGCNKHIGKGTRYNAKKEKAGKYYTTQIWEFHMKCHLCDQRFIIRTDPKNTDYEFAEGIRRKETVTAEDAIAAGTQVIDDDLTVKAKDRDAISKLEYKEDDKKKARTQKEQLIALKDLQDSRSYFDAEHNAAARRALRGRKRRAREEREEARARGLGPGVRLLPPSPVDTAAAKRVRYAGPSAAAAAARTRLDRVRAESIFAAAAPAPAAAAAAAAAAAGGGGAAGAAARARLAALHAAKRRAGVDARRFRIIGAADKPSLRPEIRVVTTAAVTPVVRSTSHQKRQRGGGIK